MCNLVGGCFKTGSHCIAQAILKFVALPASALSARIAGNHTWPNSFIYKTVLCSHHHCLVPDHFHNHKSNPTLINQSLPIL
jgi:hypothetical protein